jgi:hypothetical protein
VEGANTRRKLVTSPDFANDHSGWVAGRAEVVALLDYVERHVAGQRAAGRGHGDVGTVPSGQEFS